MPMMDANTTTPESTPPPQSERTVEASARCRNAIRDGSRSLTEFPDALAARIAEHEATLRAELKPKSELQSLAITELARASVQKDYCEDQLYVNEARVLRNVDVSWHDDQRAHVNRMGARLANAPERLAHELGTSLQGAEYCLERWIGLRDAVATNGKLTDAQRALCFDLLGVSPLLRDNTRLVPAADDAEGLKSFLAQQVTRIETRIETELKDRDVRAQEDARRGLATARDAETRRVRSNAARAHKRFARALDTAKELWPALFPAAVAAAEAPRPAPAAPVPPQPATAPAPATAPPSSPRPSRAEAASGPAWTGPPPRTAEEAHQAEREKAQRRAERMRRNSPQSNVDGTRTAAAAH
jgi:hypothetical protein